MSEALERARRERLGQVDPDGEGDETVEPPKMSAYCAKCNCIGFPELVDLVRGTVEMVCPGCHHVWIADRSAIPTA